MKQSHDTTFTIGIGGAAGDGVRESGQTLGTILANLGYEVFLSFTYPSLIRGGHNFVRLSFSKEKVHSDHTALDILISLNEETTVLHRHELAENAVVFADSFEDDDMKLLKDKAVTLPMSNTTKEIQASPIMRNSMALGAICYLINLPYDMMQELLAKLFKDKNPEMNIKLADKGYEQLKNANFKHTKEIEPSTEKKQFLDGNTAFAKGLMAAGLEFYIAYPMTPATSILHYMAKKQAESDLRVIQPESELSVINMALGISYAGKRVAIGSASGGFALMQEGFSFGNMAELPLVIAVSQRQAPATGLPTYSSQTDLHYVLHAGHGEFPRIVIAPGDAEEAFYIGAEALNLAWKYQMPVIVLLDKIISEHSSTSLIDHKDIKIELGNLEKNPNEEYGRYKITKDGISPLAFPGTPNTIVKVTSYEHDEYGITTEEAEKTLNMIDKRFAKGETLHKELKNHETIKIYGDKNADIAVVFWGSAKGPILESMKYLKKSIKFIQILYMEPFPSEKLIKELHGMKNIIDIEYNHGGELASLIREKTGILIENKVLKYDARPFDPLELAQRIEKRLK